MLVRDDPAAPLLAQAEREPQAQVRLFREFPRGTAAQQGVGVGDVVAER